MMATHTTTAAGFETLTADDSRMLFQVNPDLPASAALDRAVCLAESIRELVLDGVSGGSLDAPTCYLLGFAADAIGALCQSAGAS